jgi:endonuclease-3
MYYTAHLNLIRLGREVCHARKPDCPRCPVLELCDYGREQLGMLPDRARL